MEHTNAKFRLIEYRFPTFSFNAPKPYSEEEKEVSIQLKFTPQGLYIPASRLFKVIVDVQISANGESQIQIRCEATFEFERELNDLPDYFYANSIAIVYPYIRAFCSLITTQSNNTGIILPVLNLMGLGEELKQNTTVQENDTDNQIIPGSSLC